MNPVSDTAIAASTSAAALDAHAQASPATASELNALFGKSGNGSIVGGIVGLILWLAGRYGFDVPPDLITPLTVIVGAIVAKVWSEVTRQMARAAVLGPAAS